MRGFAIVLISLNDYNPWILLAGVVLTTVLVVIAC